MNQTPIGFRELLERVLPVELLPAIERSRVRRALRNDVGRELQAAALLVLERLEAQGDLRRIPPARNGRSPVLRYQSRDESQVITVELPGPTERDGIIAYPRSSLPSRAPADLRQVRRLLRIEEIGALSDPQGADARAALQSQLTLAALEMLEAAEVRLVPMSAEDRGPLEGVYDSDLAAQALACSEVLLYCPDVTRSRRLAAAVERAATRALVVVGVVSSDAAPLGLLEVRSVRTAPFQVEDLARIALLADCCASSLERTARLQELAFRDPMTRAYNKAYFELQARNEMARAQRERASMALLIADLDNFKALNTLLGYEAANQVLVEVAETLRRGVRPFDTVARWGGEEFAVLLTAPVHAEDARAISERLRAAVQQLRLRLEGLDGRQSDVGVTVSIGAAMFPEHADDARDLWRAANRALLEAKRPPKNQVVFFRPESGSETRRGADF